MEKNKGLIFVMFHVLFVYPGFENWRKLKHLIFVMFHVPGVENQRLDFFDVLCTWGHDNLRKLKYFNFVKFRVMIMGEN